MHAVILLLVSAVTAGPPARPLTVFVPEDARPEACFADETVAAILELTPDHRVLRGRMLEGEMLDAARRRFGADLALRGTRALAEGDEKVTLELAQTDGATEQRAASGPRLDQVDVALAAIWPKDLPKPRAVGAAAAASPEALEAACKGDATGAYARSGAAIGRAVRGLVAPAGGEARGLLGRWAKASALARAGRAREAAVLLKGVVAALARGESGPVWRRELAGPAPSALDLLGPTAVAFQEGAFAGVDAASGLVAWRRTVGRAHPHLLDLGDGAALALLEGRIEALALADGKMRWVVALEAPAPEVVRTPARIFAGGRENVVAVDRASGEVAWRFDPARDMEAGPVLTGKYLAVPQESEVVLLDPESGQVVKRIDVGDEISAPLTATAKGDVWALVGGDQAVRVEPTSGTIAARARDLPGIEWPAVASGDGLVVAFRRGARRFLADLDAGPKNGVRRLYPGGLPPLVALPGDLGVLTAQDRPPQLIARGPDGGVLWRASELRRIAEVAVTPVGVLVAAGTRVVTLDPRRGTVDGEIELGEPVRAVAAGPGGGAALVEGGVLYGLPGPDDPRPARWLRDARLELARIAGELGDAALARQLARQVLDAAPDDVEALALAARGEERKDPRGAVEHWRRLGARLPDRDPLQAEAARALSSLAGVTGPLVLDAPARRLVAAGDVAVARTDAGVVAVAACAADPAGSGAAGGPGGGANSATGGGANSGPGGGANSGPGGCANSANSANSAAGAPCVRGLAVRWRAPGAEVTALGDGLVRVGDDVVRASDGQRVRKLDAEPVFAAPGALLRRQGGELVAEAADGRALWRRPLADPRIGVLDASEDFVVVGAPGASEAQVLRASSGEPTSAVSLGEPAAAAVISGPVVLFRTGARLIDADAETGKSAFKVTLAAPEGGAAPPRIERVPVGWLIVEGQRLRAIDRARGRTVFSTRLAAPVEQLALAGPPGRANTAIAALADGTVAAVDLARGTLRGHVKLGRMQALAADGATVYAVDEAGAVLAIDAIRGLSPGPR